MSAKDGVDQFSEEMHRRALNLDEQVERGPQMLERFGGAKRVVEILNPSMTHGSRRRFSHRRLAKNCIARRVGRPQALGIHERETGLPIGVLEARALFVRMASAVCGGNVTISRPPATRSPERRAQRHAGLHRVRRG